MKFLICKHCGNLYIPVNDAGVPLVCCGENMSSLEPNTTDAAHEKHLPVAASDGSILYISVGEAAHPMSDEHHIAWVYLETKNGGQLKYLPHDAKPELAFSLHNDLPVAVYSYCNLHGLWKTEL